ncbi:MAG: Gfo/Idh/MocA family oxidoreductase, partial [Bacteroidota bacterium]
WKGDLSKSGGIATNIGIHFFDMLTWIFGKLESQEVHLHNHDRAAGYLEFERARVRWILSINDGLLPSAQKQAGKRTYRALEIDQQLFEFSDGFTDLHNLSYQKILSGDGFSLEDATPSIEIVQQIRASAPLGLNGRHHPLADQELSNHPFDHSNK